MPYRFVHAADIHLDSPLRSLALRNPDLASLIGDATRQAFVRTIDLCLAERVDALLLAGDLYDGEQTSIKTALFLAGQIHRLHEAGIRAFIIRGNHDALSKITKELVFPDSVKIFGGWAEAVAVERARTEFPVAIHGLSFAQPQAPESLVGRYKPPVEGAVNIGLLHTSLAGSPGHDAYAPCKPSDLHATGFRYWALGHIHKRSVTDGACMVVMPGMPQGRDINEAGAKSVTLVTVADDRSIRVEERHTGIAQFERLTIDMAGLDDWRELVARVCHHVERAHEGVASEHVVVRLRLAGATPLAWRIRHDLELLRAEAEAKASATGKVWIDKLEIDCPVPVPAASVEPSADPLAELRRLIDRDVAGSDTYRAAMLEIAEELRGQLPQECRHLLGADEASLRSRLDALVGESVDDMLARLHAMAPGGAGCG